MNILSIDWDYYIDASMNERIYLFPDGGNEDIPIKIQNVVWIYKYADSVVEETFRKKEHKKGLQEIGVNNIAIRDTYEIIKKHIKDTTRIRVRESHKDIAEVLIHKNTNNEVKIFNVDFHHDCYGTEEKINCGNWVRILLKQKRINEIYWVKRKDSDTEGIQKEININIDTKIKNWEDKLSEGIDEIFICRSAMWSPPHLDKEFISFVENIINYSNKSKHFDLGRLHSRWNEESIEQINQISDQIKSLME